MIKWRLPFLAGANLALLAGILGGLWRAGWLAPMPESAVYAHHGPLMVCGFLGALISLERAVAWQKPWGYAAPAFAILAWVLIFLPVKPQLPAAAALAASIGLVSITIAFLIRFPSLHMLIMAAGAGAWMVGNAFWLSGFLIPQVVYWWAGFLVLTIAGERLELSRVLQTTEAAEIAFILAVMLLGPGMLLSPFAPIPGVGLVGISFISLALWLLYNDLARRQLRDTGLRRFMGVSLILGYLWLGAGGVFAVMWGGAQSGFHYDAILHAVFLGFVFSMIFAHAPVIFPGILGLKMQFHSLFYGPPALLAVSLVIRVAGDFLQSSQIRIVGSALNAVAILFFLANTIFAIVRTRSDQR